MARKRFGIAVLATVTILVASAAAQHSNEVAGVFGRSIIADQGVSSFSNASLHFGNGLSYEGNFSHRFLNFGIASLSVEIPFVYDPVTKVQFGAANVTPKDYKAYFLTPAARVNLFPTTAFSPWASVGVGVASYTPNGLLEFGGSSGAVSNKTVAIEFGGGLDVRFAEHFKARGEIRAFNTSEPSFNVNKGNRFNQLFAGVGIVFSF